MPSNVYHLAQANYSLWKPDVDPRAVETFVGQLDEVNALAEDCPGFIWRYVSGPGDAAVTAAFAHERAIFNMSVWLSPEHLREFAFQGRHSTIMKRRADWFERLSGQASVMWWVPSGQRPTVVQAKQKIDLINRLGPSPGAFSFARLYYPD